MKWGRKKSAPAPPPSSSSSSMSVLDRVFRVSWFSKSKQEGGDCGSKNKQKCISDFPSGLREGRFYSMDEDDAFWRLSFRDERMIQGRRSTGGINPLWNHDDSDHHDSCGRIPVSDYKRTKVEEGCMNFNEMVSEIKKMKERRGKQRSVGEKSRIPSTRQRNVDDDDQISGKFDDRNSVTEWQDFEGKKMKGIKIKPDSKKKYTNRGVLKPYSPRTECKIRALEEMKRARTKTRKKEKVLEGNSGGVFDSFAVAKNSVDPEGDFRDSMVEMIAEKGISHPEDLEDLLACYLMLNRDEYHGLIIEVFRQVWFELKGMYMDPATRSRVIRRLIS